MPLSRKDLKCTGDDYVTILHLSDLHFLYDTVTQVPTSANDEKKNSAEDARMGPPSSQTERRKERFLTHLETRISEVVTKQGHQFDLIVATGDVADNSDTKQPNDRHSEVLRKARSYLEHLTDTYCLNRRDGLFAVLGNHDYRLIR